MFELRFLKEEIIEDDLNDTSYGIFNMVELKPDPPYKDLNLNP